MRERGSWWGGDLSKRAYSHSKDGLWCLSKTGSEGKLLNLEVLDWMKESMGGRTAVGRLARRLLPGSR